MGWLSINFFNLLYNYIVHLFTMYVFMLMSLVSPYWLVLSLYGNVTLIKGKGSPVSSTWWPAIGSVDS